MVNSEKKFYLFANWKMYLDFDESVVLAKSLAAEAEKMPVNVEMAVFPSALATAAVAEILKSTSIKVGSQNVYWIPEGGYTGEISAEMFKKAGCEYALVGHSERRHQFHESNHDVRQKMEACLAAGLTPVLCVGETLKEREEDKAEEVIEVQLRSALYGLAWSSDRGLMIAYEPVWAISRGIGADEAGQHCNDIEAERIHELIKNKVRALLPDVILTLLFGGSVRPNTTAYYLKQPNISGVLVGAASTKFESWNGIMESTQ